MKFNKFFIVLVLFLMTIQSRAASLCSTKLSLVLSQNSYSLSAPTTTQINFKVKRHSHFTQCPYFITIDKGQAENYNRALFFGHNNIPFQIYQNTNITNVIQDFPELNSNSHAITGEFQSWYESNIDNHSYYVHQTAIAANMPAGTYSDVFIVRLYSGTISGPHVLEDMGYQAFSYILTNSTSLSLVDTNAPYDAYATTKTIDFGILASNVVRNFDTIVVSNTGFQLYFSSMNGGYLSHASAATFVNYMTQVNGVTRTLPKSTPVLVASSSHATPKQGTRLKVNFTIGPLANQAAGNYADTITVTVQAN